jgi:hypothetical protein
MFLKMVRLNIALRSIQVNIMVNDLKTTIINLYGGPGAGKSTSAAYLYYLLKVQGINAELVREYVKDWVYENRKIGPYNQIYFLGKQVHKESLLYGKVNYIITDSPVMMSVYYAYLYCEKELADGVRCAAEAFYNQAENDNHKHVHVFLKRAHVYNPNGRYQSEAEALQIDIGARKLLTDLDIPYIECNSDEKSLAELIETLKI